MELVELGKLATFSQGQQVSIKDQRKDYFEGSDIFLRIINYTQLSTDFRYIPKQNPKYVVSKNDIIMVRYGAVGFVGRGFSGVLANNMFKINYNEALLNSDFLYRILRSELVQNQILNSSQKTSMPAINFKTISRVKIPLPKLATQKKIAAILDEADKVRQLNKELIKKYDALTQSLFLEMFGDPVTNPKGWEKVKTIKYCKSIVPGRDKPKSFTGDIPWVTTADLEHLGITKKSRKKIGLTESEISEVRAKLIPKGSVIMTCVGDLGVVTLNKTEIIINQQLHAFQCMKELNNTFLMYNLSYQKPYMYKMASSTTVPYMNKTVSNNVPTIVPPIKLQNQFSERVQIIENQKKQAQENLQKAENLFNSLLQKAFKGELVKE